MIRLDKFLSYSGYGTRKETKKMIREKRVMINGICAKKDDIRIDEEHDIVTVDGIEVLYRSQIYLMMNKPAGYVCANEDRDPTVFDLFEQFEGKDLFTVGRLDKDTEGLLLITNDGEYAHKLTSPKHHVEKEYYVTLQKPFDSSYVAQIEKGIRINEEEQCAPAKCIVEDDYHVRLIIREGKFHQVKRMIHACENETEHLVRLRIGNLWLDETLEAGEYREMTDEELVLSLDREDE